MNYFFWVLARWRGRPMMFLYANTGYGRSESFCWFCFRTERVLVLWWRAIDFFFPWISYSENTQQHVPSEKLYKIGNWTRTISADSYGFVIEKVFDYRTGRSRCAYTKVWTYKRRGLEISYLCDRIIIIRPRTPLALKNTMCFFVFLNRIIRWKFVWRVFSLTDRLATIIFVIKPPWIISSGTGELIVLCQT